MNGTTATWVLVYLLESLLSVSGDMPEAELLGRSVNLLLVVRGASVLFSTVAAPTSFP